MRFYPHVTDQMAHCLVAFAILSLASLGTFAACASAGLAMGLIRETAEASGSRISVAEVAAHFRKRDPWIDLLFWTLGGAALGLLL